MAYYRKLPSGLWQVTIRGHDRKRHTHTARLKKVVQAWAKEHEARFSSGDRRDPRAGDIRIGDWQRRVFAARSIEGITRAKNDSLWSVHCEPQWAGWPLAAPTRMEAQEWAARLASTRRASHGGKAAYADGGRVPLLSPATIADIVHVMSGLYRAALRESPPLVAVNPFADLELPVIEPRPVEFYEHEEAAALYKAAGDSRALVELGMDVGLRPGELFGLHGRRMDWLRGKVEVVDVMTRQGLRRHPKSKRSHRTVPVPPATMERLSALVKGREVLAECRCPLVTDTEAEREAKAAAGRCPGLIFTATMGGPVSDDHFRDRTWYPAVTKAGVRRFPPRIMRHTAASWLVIDGVPLTDVQALLGHESYETTLRYAHLRPDAHEKVVASWGRRGDAAGSQ